MRDGDAAGRDDRGFRRDVNDKLLRRLLGRRISLTADKGNADRESDDDGCQRNVAGAVESNRSGYRLPKHEASMIR